VPSPALPVRIISDPFPVYSGGSGGHGRAGNTTRGKPGDKPGAPAAFGRYGCCEKGLVLIRGGRDLMTRYESGTLADFVFQGTEKRDPKSGALILDAGERNAIPVRAGFPSAFSL
jgi:hypothetical protein